MKKGQYDDPYGFSGKGNNSSNPEKKKKKEKRKKKKAGKIVLRVFLILIAVIVAFVGVTTAVSVVGLKANLGKANSFPKADCAQLSFENVSSGNWNVKSDNGLKVLQLTDVHLGGGWMSIKKDTMALNAVASMITEEKPDFVIVTGDVAYPVPFQAGTFNNKSGAKLFAALMEDLGVYWTISFGNHDTEAYSYYSRKEITDFYSSEDYPHCLLQAGPDDVDGSGNQVFNILNSDGVITRSLILMDSHSYIDGDIFGIEWKYDNIHENQIQWYKDTIEGINKRNLAAFARLDAVTAAKYADFTEAKSSVFFHIPIAEYGDAWNAYAKNGYVDTADVKYIYGVAGEAGETVYSGIHDDNVFETMLELGSTDTVFCGHDHLNNFSLNYKGINLTYGMSVDYLAYIGIYKKGAQRGCTVINYAADGTVQYNQENYYQSKFVSYLDKESVEDIK